MKVEKELLEKRIAEARHNEIRAGVTTLIGIITASASLYIESTGKREWYTLAVLGLIVTIIGAIIGVYHTYKRSQLIKQLRVKNYISK